MASTTVPHAEEAHSAVSKHAGGRSHAHLPALTRRGALGLITAAAFAGPASRLRAESHPAVLGSALDASGGVRIGRLNGALEEAGGAPVPVRVHALSPRPDGLEAVAVGRRPGDIAFVLDGRGAAIRSTFRASQGRKFSGHGAYAERGATFLSAEIDAATGEGFVVVRDVAGGYAPRAAYRSAGVGPHELVAVGGLVAVANGAKEPKAEPGIAALGRTRVRSNVALVDAATGEVNRVAEIEADMSSLSLRHLVAAPGGVVLVGAQDTTAGAHDLPLIARLSGDRLDWIDPGYEVLARFGGYIGQLSLDASGRYLAASGPVGGVVGVFDLENDQCLGVVPAPDCCAVAADGTVGGFIASTGLGEVLRIASHEGGAAIVGRRATRLRWDNHLAALG